jgi:hypothetical protein
VLAATAPAWVQITDGGTTLYSGILQPGQTYNVPPTATAPLLKTGKAEALRITVGTAVAPTVGPAATKVSNVSLRPADLLKGPQAAAPAERRSAPPPAAPLPTTNTGE